MLALLLESFAHHSSSAIVLKRLCTISAHIRPSEYPPILTEVFLALPGASCCRKNNQSCRICQEDERCLRWVFGKKKKKKKKKNKSPQYPGVKSSSLTLLPSRPKLEAALAV
ncbi:hypothetical protein HZ326_16099 [Fusarium oxysporum f. sp. albedinis]|nr:hypothetical protein HZ326_16099 [Fusarium oxysporum f. sp. albedinis]